MDNNIPQWITAICTGFLVAASMILAVVALFQDIIRKWLMRPELDIAFNLRRPDCQMFPTPEENFFSVRVKNSGRTTAERVEVVVSHLFVRRDDDSFELVDYYLPKNLIWSDDQDIYTYITATAALITPPIAEPLTKYWRRLSGQRRLDDQLAGFTSQRPRRDPCSTSHRASSRTD